MDVGLGAEVFSNDPSNLEANVSHSSSGNEIGETLTNWRISIAREAIRCALTKDEIIKYKEIQRKLDSFFYRVTIDQNFQIDIDDILYALTNELVDQTNDGNGQRSKRNPLRANCQKELNMQ